MAASCNDRLLPARGVEILLRRDLPTRPATKGRMMQLKFSKWVKYDEREQLENINFPGVYAIAISSTDISYTSFDYIEEIAYFGMTNSRSGLKGRLSAFNNSLRDKSGAGHGGALRFRYVHNNGNELARNLYVAVCSFPCTVTSIARQDLETMGDVLKAEYIAFAEYAERYGRLPKYNDKQRSPKAKPHARQNQ